MNAIDEIRGLMHHLGSCSVCGVYPWDAPLGQFCTDEDLHDFPGRRAEERVTLPARSSAGRLGARTSEAIDPGRPA